MYSISTVKDEKCLKEVFNFLSSLFYEDALENNEHYYTMSDRLEEMKRTFEIDKDFLMYIEDNDKIIAALTGKSLDLNKGKITIGVIGVSNSYRRKGIAKLLITEFEKRCLEKNIKHIDLGARFRACPLYLDLNYKPSLMIQVFDFSTIDDIRKNNKFNFRELSSYQSDIYGFIFYEIDEVKEEYIKWFEQSVKTAHAQFIFEKDLEV